MAGQEIGWKFDNTYSRLPSPFYVRQNPVSVRAPQLAVVNFALAETLGLDSAALASAEGLAIFAGNAVPPGADPIAQAYAGHQFGHFTMLGDGRAVLLGEHIAPGGARFDIQLKGSGQTPFSRRGDGRAALGPMLREYIISEAMHGLGIPSTRSLAVVTTGEPVFRERPLPGAILTRVAASHIRVGTFEYAAAATGPEGVRALADYTLHRHYPDLAQLSEPYLALLQAVMERQASLLAKWMHAGFIHGVMNTDNMAISGESIDYGPCAFMDSYSPSTLFSSIDRHGRYAYGNQPRIAEWNLTRFAEALLPLLHSDLEQATAKAKEALAGFSALFQRHWLAGMRAKLGLAAQEEADLSLIEDFLGWMEKAGADYTITFRALAEEKAKVQDPEIAEWHARWQARLQRESMQNSLRLMRAHSAAVIPRNHRVEEALEAAVVREDFTVMHKLLEALKRPYEDLPDFYEYRAPPASGDDGYQTFCGT